MRLGDLSAGLAGLVGAGPVGAEADVEVSSLAYDSRAVSAGTLFFCVPGFQADGHRFAPAAVRDGAVALVVERPLGLGVPELLVDSVRAAMGPIAARLYGEPAEQLEVVGVTGTNGKTTSAYLIRELLEAAGTQCGLLGTVKSVIGGQERAVVRTTPEAIDLQMDLREMVDGGDRACAIEVSSHALELGRAAAIPFAAALFTNLTQDHLDFHPTMEDYFLAKRRLFVGDGRAPGVSVVNVADPYGRRLADELPNAVTFAVGQPADYSATELRCGFGGCSFTLRSPEGEHVVALPMPGRFNVANALGALAVAHRLGVPLAEVLRTLERGVRVPGRFEPVDRGQDFAVLVDYAHTPDSLENVLAAAGELLEGSQDGRVLCVFGAGGDRDRGKRPLMGEIAARLADVTIVTSDNPRSEVPGAIIEEIMAGAGEVREGVLETIEDRRAAIARAVALACPGDVLVIAGKGHEQGQELAGGRKIPFDDVTAAAEALDARRGALARAAAG
ncbi:MAG TPA: UDP-N-acetylmuramoyl-L-alanyl-D-glutamate--2,6-diaminopimelate ligase [Solirubrobacteraceae bacterium]|nr:UDP-N-acetylmuramoyl-L-alanyl-D-glutamate--2,6-diaminopimelate ligase [Solirubrobacteraceae bacterium]